MEAKKKALLILSIIAAVSLVMTVLLQRRFAESTRWDAGVYRGTHHFELTAGVTPVINIITAGMPVQLEVWDGDTVKVTAVAELPLMISEEIDEGYAHEITIIQDDGFAISFFTLDLFRYNMRVYLPRAFEYEQINIVSAGGEVGINSYHLRVIDGVTIETNNGSVSVTRPTAEYTVQTQSGDVMFDFDFLVSPVVINSHSGNIELKIPDTVMHEIESRDWELLFARTQSGELTIVEKAGSVPLL
jgi:hypothetical protein